jgi:hypothetical protein
MKLWWRKLAVLLLFLALPLQGVAATFATLSCLTSDEHQTVQSHVHGHQDGAPHHHDGDVAGDHSPHHCCHFFTSSLPATEFASASPDLPVFESSISLLSTLFIPEQPQRPPRT